jgi:hypothetical protein
VNVCHGISANSHVNQQEHRATGGFMMGAVSALEILASTLELMRAGKRLFFQCAVIKDVTSRENNMCIKGTIDK